MYELGTMLAGGLTFSVRELFRLTGQLRGDQSSPKKGGNTISRQRKKATILFSHKLFGINYLRNGKNIQSFDKITQTGFWWFFSHVTKLG